MITRSWIIRLLLASCLIGLGWWLGSRSDGVADARPPSIGAPAAAEASSGAVPKRPERVEAVAGLPAEVAETLALIDRGGPFPYAKDGTVFQNREGQLPKKPRGYYREYTVPTPGTGNRGARRLVGGADGEIYYTGDHYRTFKRLRP